MPKWVWNVLRVVVSLGILAFILSRIPWADHEWTVVSRTQAGDGQESIQLRDARTGAEKVLEKVHHFNTAVGETWTEPGFLTVCKDIHLPWLLAALAVFWMAPALQAIRWRRLLHVQDVHLSIAKVLRLMWVGLFFNLFLLGAVGGDLVKAYYVSHHSPKTRAESIITVLVDRIIGLLGLVWLSMVAMLVCLVSGYRIEGGLPWLWLTPGAVVLFGGVIFYSDTLRNVLGVNWLIGRLPQGLRQVVLRLDRAVNLYRHHKALVGEAFIWTFLSHLCLLLTILLILRSLGLPASSLGTVIICTPLILVATGIIPSIGGLGIQEYGFVLFFGPLVAATGRDPMAVALAASLAYRLVTILASLPGALVLMLGAHLPSRSQMQAEMQQAAN
jgi:uncharacterized protein (TIRG00374 family)